VSADEPDEQEVVEAAAEAAENVVFSHLEKSAVEDLDVTVRFEEGVLETDVYVHAPEEPDELVGRTADDAALAARGAVDELLD
jgi:hypothetical protein